MQSLKFGNLWGFKHLFLALVLLLCIPVAARFLSRQSDFADLYHGFTEKILANESALQKSSTALVKNFDTLFLHKSNGSLLDETSGRDPDGIVLFVFKHDSIAWWNSNREVFPKTFPSSAAVGTGAYHFYNGWYECSIVKHGSWTYVAAILLKNDYSVRNKYLGNAFSDGIGLPAEVIITRERTAFPVFSSAGTYLLSISAGPDPGRNIIPYTPLVDYTSMVEAVYLVLFLLGSGFLLLFIYRQLHRVRLLKESAFLFIVCFTVIVVTLRVFQCHYRFPGPLYQSALFSPAWYSSSVFLPSAGDFLINALLLFIFAFLARRSFKNDIIKELTPFLQAVGPVLLFAGYAGVLFLMDYLLTSLVINSSFPLNLQNIAGLIPASFSGLLILIILCGAFLLISNLVLDKIFAIAGRKIWIFPGLAGLLLLSGFAAHVAGINFHYPVLLFAFVYLTGYRYFSTRRKPSYTIQNILFMVFFWALFSTYILQVANIRKEGDRISLLALSLSSRKNPVTEYRYAEIHDQLTRDPVLTAMIQSGLETEPKADSLDAYLRRTYFNDHWRQYTIQVTLCTQNRELKVQPQGYLIGCNLYFAEMISNYGDSTATPGLFLLDYGYGKEYYLAKLEFPDSSGVGKETACMYLEFTLNGNIPDPGYPGLLLDGDRPGLTVDGNYSYALYQDNRLVHAVGQVNYRSGLTEYPVVGEGQNNFGEDGIKHYRFTIDRNTVLLISVKQQGFLAVITPFSYLFFLFAVIALFLTGFSLARHGFRSGPVDLRIKLQLSLTGILILTMVVIGLVQVLYIINISEKKNQDNLREKAYSVQTEVQHKYGANRSVAEILTREPENFLIKLSNVFFTDINFYDPEGFLIASSRQKIFSEGLISERMNPAAYRKMIVEQQSLLIHEEMIGSMKFASVYVPMHNDRGDLLGYVNLPYFARQDELKKEISSFLVTFVNIYILLIIFGALISILIANYITMPLAMLAGKMSLLRLGKPNERIPWKNDDEIGRLVSEYNRMIDELEKSAGQLARTERETAWRQMARQVAHEIKNPLTPMKLSAQYLQKAWNEKAPDMDLRIARFTRTLVEQIDTLAAIASDFSDFARMPQSRPEKLDPAEVIKTVLSWYPETPGIRYVFEQSGQAAVIIADRAQFSRALTNLINNAIQAIGHRTDGMVGIVMTTAADRLVIGVTDNGHGIPADQILKIFQPDFTTKSGGMGLGLAIVKGIILDMKGEISVTSEENAGTTFTISLPIYNQQNDQNEV